MYAFGFGMYAFLCHRVMLLKRTAMHRKMKKATWRDPSSSQLFCSIIASGFLVSLRIYYRKDARSFLHEIPLQRKENVFQKRNISRQLSIYSNINKNMSCVYYLAVTEKINCTTQSKQHFFISVHKASYWQLSILRF